MSVYLQCLRQILIWTAEPIGKCGRQPVYSDAAVRTCLKMKAVLGLALRQTTGFVESLLQLVDLDCDVPDFRTLNRRQKTLAVNISHRGLQGPLRLLSSSHDLHANYRQTEDSIGIKVESKGEWNGSKSGGTNRRVWRNVHFGLAAETSEVRAI